MPTASEGRNVVQTREFRQVEASLRRGHFRPLSTGRSTSRSRSTTPVSERNGAGGSEYGGNRAPTGFDKLNSSLYWQDRCLTPTLGTQVSTTKQNIVI